MQRRLLLIALVFVAGFGVGYGITWIFVGSPDRPDKVASAPAKPAPIAAGELTPSPDAGAAPVGAPDAVAAADASAPTPDAAGGPEVAVAAVDAAGAAQPEVAVAPVEPAPAAWEVCKSRVCRLDFGDVSGGISIRRGKFEHGQTVDWDKDFGRAEKVGMLDAGKNVRLEVIAIGLTDGEPSAAYVSRKVKRSTQMGVIALKIGDKRLSLVPIEE